LVVKLSTQTKGFTRGKAESSERGPEGATSTNLS